MKERKKERQTARLSCRFSGHRNMGKLYRAASYNDKKYKLQAIRKDPEGLPYCLGRFLLSKKANIWKVEGNGKA